MFAVDEGLLHEAAHRLAGRGRLWFLLGGAGSGKTTVARDLGERFGVDVVDMDERLYGSWHGTFDPVRHPVSTAWSRADDPLGWLLGLAPEAFLAFQAASAAEALDRLADEVRQVDPSRPVLVDGGFGSIAVPARAVTPARIACLSVPPAERNAVWTGSPDRRAFLDLVAGVEGVSDPVGRFLALDRRLSDALDAEAVAAGVHRFERDPALGASSLANRVAAHLGIG